MSDSEFVAGESGAAETYPIQAGALKKGMHCVIKDRPCKIIEYTTSKTGKHGHAKANIVAIDIFTNKKLEEICPTSHNMYAPNVSRAEYQLVDINEEGELSLLDAECNEKNDLNLPNDDELATRMKQMFESGKDLLVTVVTAMGEQAVMGVKEATA